MGDRLAFVQVIIAMWCTRWFLPLLLLPLPTAPPYFLVLFLLTLALHARPCFYCIILLAALFLSSCYWQSFPLEAQLSVPWADNITTFSQALNATLPPHLTAIEFAPPIIRVADRCWCDFASGLFEPYDVQKWERDSIEKAVAQIEKDWKKRFEPENDAHSNATATAEPEFETIETITPESPSTGADIFLTFLRSVFTRRSTKSEPVLTTTNATDPSTLLETPSQSPHLEASIPVVPSLSPGQLDMRPYGFDLIFDLRWSRKS